MGCNASKSTGTVEGDQAPAVNESGEQVAADATDGAVTSDDGAQNTSDPVEAEPAS